MRALIRTTAALACAVALATCADAPTGPLSRTGMPARVALAPRFSTSALEASSALRQAGIEVASVRVTITRTSNGDALFDRTIAVTPGQASVTLEAEVLLRSVEEELTAFMEFLDTGGTVLYRGEQRVIARAGSNAAVTVDAEIEFVGPGAAATTVRLAPADTTISTATPLAMTAAAVDAAGATITAPILLWSSSDAAVATVSATGLVTPAGPRGSVQVSARTPLGIKGIATVRLIPPPARIVVVGGGAQSGAAGTVLAQPFTVEVQAADGLPVPGQVVTFSAVTPGGSVAVGTATADAQGRASTSIKLGTAAGRYEFRAVSGSVGAVTIEASATPAAASMLAILSGNAQTGQEGTSLQAPLVVAVTDTFGNATPGASVAWTVTSGNASVAQATTTTDASSTASNAVTLGSPANFPATATIKAKIVSGASVSFTATITPKPLVPAKLVVAQQPPATARSGAVLGAPVRVQVADSAGTPIAVAGRVVTAAVHSASVNRLPGDGSAALVVASHSLTGTTSVSTDAAGIATFSDLTITGIEGPVTLSFGSAALPTASSSTITLTAGDVATLAIRPSVPTAPFVVTAGEAIAENVWLETADASGNRVPDVPVRFVARRDGPTGVVVGDTTIPSNGIGEIGAASFPVVTSAGTYHVAASITAASATPVMFTVQVNPSTAGATTSAVGATTIPINVGPVSIGARSVVVRDAQGVGLPNLAVTFSLAGTGANGSFTGDVYEVSSMTDGSGVASFPAGVTWTPPAPEGSYAMTVIARNGATQVGGSVTFTAVRTQWSYRITATPAAPAPSTSVALAAQLVDGHGASLTASPVRNVTWSMAVGTAPAANFATTSLASDGSTSASFTSDAASGAVHAITVTDNSFAISGTATVTNTGTPGPSAIVYGSTGPATSGDLQVANVGDTLAQPLLVKVLDGNGSPLANVGVEWRRRSNLSEGVVVDTTTTDTAGVASLRPALPVEDTFLGHIFEAAPVTGTSLVLRFRAAARTGTEDAVWFGPAVGDGSTPLGYADWAIGSNWSGGIVPGSSSNVLVPAWDNSWVASPQLTGSVTVTGISTGSGFDFPYLDLGTHELTVGGAVNGSLVAGTGTIRMAGTSGTVAVHAPSATLMVPTGANVTLDGFTRTKHVTVGGTLHVGEQSLQLEGGELLVSGQLLVGGGSVYGGMNVLFDNTTFDSTNTGSITFGQLFEQRGTTKLALPEFFTVYADVGTGGKTATIRLADSSSSLGALVVTGPDAGTPSTLVMDGAVAVSGELVVNGLVNVTGTLLRLESDNVVLPVTVDLSGLATLESHGYYAPMFGGAAPQMTEIWAAELNGPSQFTNLRVRKAVQVYWHPFLVNGSLEVLGQAGGLRITNVNDTVVVKGTATFAGGATVLRNGMLRLGGDLVQRGSAAEFRPDTGAAAMTVVFEGTAPQKIDFESPHLDAGGSYLPHVVVAPGAQVTQSTAMAIAGKATVEGKWNAALPLNANHVDIRGTEAPGRLETHAGTSIRRLDMQAGSQWWNGASSALGVNGANFFSGAQIWNYAGQTLQVEVCYNANPGYVLMDNTQVYFSCTLEMPYGYAANLTPMPSGGSSPAAAPARP